MNDKLLARVSEIIKENLDLPNLEITLELSAEDVPEWDSFSHLRILFEIERQFDVTFDTAEIVALKNVGDFIHLLSSKLNKL
jgi:acyl carrier protein